jgi:hypothetical protein
MIPREINTNLKEVTTLPISHSKPVKIKLTIISDNKDAIVTSIKALGHLLEGSFSEVTYTKPAWDLSPSTNRYKFVIDMSITGHSKQEVDDTFTVFRTMASDTF